MRPQAFAHSVLFIDFSESLLILMKGSSSVQVIHLIPPLFIDAFHLPVSIEQLLCAFCKQHVRACVGRLSRGENSCLTENHFF